MVFNGELNAEVTDAQGNSQRLLLKPGDCFNNPSAKEGIFIFSPPQAGRNKVATSDLTNYTYLDVEVSHMINIALN